MIAALKWAVFTGLLLLLTLCRAKVTKTSVRRTFVHSGMTWTLKTFIGLDRLVSLQMTDVCARPPLLPMAAGRTEGDSPLISSSMQDLEAGHSGDAVYVDVDVPSISIACLLITLAHLK